MLPRRSSKPQAEPPGGYLQRTDVQLKRERIDKLIAEIRVNRPWWASRPPWEVEKHLEAGAKSQAVLPFDGGPAR